MIRITIDAEKLRKAANAAQLVFWVVAFLGFMSVWNHGKARKREKNGGKP